MLLPPGCSGWRCSGRGEDRADAGVAAAGGIGGDGTLPELAQAGTGVSELGDPLPDVIQVPVDQLGDVPARGLASVVEGQDAADLGEGEPGGLGVADEREPRQRPGRVAR